MTRSTTGLMLLMFSPTGPIGAEIEAGRRGQIRDLATYGMLALLIFLLVEEGFVIYAIWLFTVLVHGAYQYRYVFASQMDRPVLYEEVSLVLFAIDLLNHVAVAVLCGVGWWGIAPLAFAWFHSGRTVGRLAVAKEIEQILRIVGREYPDERPERQMLLAHKIFRERVGDLQNL